MQIELALVDIDAGLVADVFEERIAHRLIDHLRNECILDQDGVSRLLPLLRRAFMGAGKGVSIKALMTTAPDGSEPPLETQASARALAEDIVVQAGKVLDENRMNFMLSLATVLAEQDERLNRRVVH